ncbi:phosphate ABC transporter substrate-binding protein PstS [Streptomyces sp. NPDC059396]|uniref:phosphate ABC transporter substrate-binding protein PstS n=1 Tax=Streptomyces sp. NPDC059396 TaxID=3346819 RepID=UPI003674714A
MVKALAVGDPESVGPYRLTGLLGIGGMGRVYLAASPGGRQVALKVIRPELADEPGFRERFAREASAAQAVSGAFTAAVVGADPHGAAPWLATLYVPGLSLAEAIGRHGPLPEWSVYALGAGLAEALQAIHAAGLIHRDLKPSNVLLASDGPRVIDFGIAMEAGSDALTSTGLIVGTPGFMAPEQFTRRNVGPAADVFCLGAVLAFAGAGHGPFGTGSSHAMGYRVVHEEPDLAGLPPRVRDVIARCLAKDADARPTVPQLLHELAGLVAAGPQPGPEAPPLTTDRTQTLALALRESPWLPSPLAAAVGRVDVGTGAGTAGGAGSGTSSGTGTGTAGGTSSGTGTSSSGTDTTPPPAPAPAEPAPVPAPAPAEPTPTVPDAPAAEPVSLANPPAAEPTRPALAARPTPAKPTPVPATPAPRPSSRPAPDGDGDSSNALPDTRISPTGQSQTWLRKHRTRVLIGALAVAAVASVTPVLSDAFSDQGNPNDPGSSSGRTGQSPDTSGSPSSPDAKASSTAPVCDDSGQTLVASGSSTLGDAIDTWSTDYAAACPGTQINYDAKGSGAGINEFLRGLNAFAGSDSPLKPTEAEQSKSICQGGGTGINLPMLGTPIAFAYDLAGVDDLVLDAPTLAKIFSDKITQWNDPAIAELNPTADLPDKRILAFHRADESGVNFTLGKFLVAAAGFENWPYTNGNRWMAPGGQSIATSDQLMAEVQSTDGAIGYAELIYATNRSMNTVKLRTGAAEPVAPTPATASRALADARVVGTGKDLALDLNYTTAAKGAYPLLGVTYEIVCDKGNLGATLDALKSFLTYTAGTEAQQTLTDLDYAPLPAPLATKVRQTVETID